MAKRNRKPVQVDQDVIDNLKKEQARMLLEEGKAMSLGEIVKEKLGKNKQNFNFKIKFDGGTK